jgi:hypothetical protein
LQVEPIRLYWSEFVQSLIDALETFFQRGAEEIPPAPRFIRARLRKHVNTSLQSYGVGHRGAVALPLQHQPVGPPQNSGGAAPRPSIQTAAWSPSKPF